MRLSSRIAATLALAALSTVAHAQVSSFSFGTEDFGSFGLQNTSTDPTAQISAVTIDLTGTDTFFDTTDDSPGNSSGGFSLFFNNGVAIVTFPSDAATDGTQIATVTFTGFDADDSFGADVDFDLFLNPDGDGAPAGGLVTVLFSNNLTASGTILATPISLSAGGGNTQVFSLSATGSVQPAGGAVPEPSALAVGGVFAASLLGLIARRRTK